MTVSPPRPFLSNNKATDNKSEKISIFKNISKILKRKKINDEDLNNHNNIFNSNTYNSQQKFIISAPMSPPKRNIKFNNNQKSTENSNHSKNIYISNNITNNNYYTIQNNSKGKVQLLLNKFSKKNDTKTKQGNNLIKFKNKNESRNNIYLKSESNIESLSNISNNKLNNKKENSKRTIKCEILSPYKSGLIRKTTLKSIDKYTLKSLLNRFNIKNSKEKLKFNKSNNQINNNNNYKTINNPKNEKTEKDENKIRLKKR